MRVDVPALSNTRFLNRRIVTIRHLDEPHSSQNWNVVVAQDLEDFVLLEDGNSFCESRERLVSSKFTQPRLGFPNVCDLNIATLGNILLIFLYL